MPVLKWRITERFILCGYFVCALALHSVKALQFQDQNDFADQLTRKAEIEGPTLSVNGQWLAAITTARADKGALTVWYEGRPIAEGDALPYEPKDIAWYDWIGGGRLIISLNGVGLLQYDAAIGSLAPVLESAPRPLDAPVQLLATVPGDRNQFVISWINADDTYPAIYRVNVDERSAEKLFDPFPPVRRWWASEDGTIAVGEGFSADRKKLFRQNLDGLWEAFRDVSLLTDPSVDVVAVARGGRQVYLSEAVGNTGRRVVKRLPLGAPKNESIIFDHESHDTGEPVFDPSSGFLIGITHGIAGLKASVLNTSLSTLQALIEPFGNYCAPQSGGPEGANILMICNPPGRPKSFWIIDTKANKAKRLDTGTLDKFIYRVEARLTDGPVPLPYLVAEPTSRSKDRGTVMWVHGGPHDHAAGLFDPTIAYLVANGFTVIMPNVRGSTGYGDAFERAGWGEWGTRMQTDLYTVALHLTGKDPSLKGRIMIAGISYGGYASLLAAAERKDIFACALSINGVTNLGRFFGAMTGANDFFTNRFLGPQDEQTLWQRSPLSRMHILQAPTLLIHGSADERVPIDHFFDYVELAKKKFIPIKTAIIEGADHSFSKAEHVREMWQTSTRYLSTCDLVTNKK